MTPHELHFSERAAAGLFNIFRPHQRDLKPLLEGARFFKRIDTYSNPDLMKMLQENWQPCNPRGEITETRLIPRETIWAHTERDFVMAYAFLFNKPGLIIADVITFPPKGIRKAEVQKRLKYMIKKTALELSLNPFRNNFLLMDLFNVFMLNHDIAKRGDEILREGETPAKGREAHETEGAVIFKGKEYYFRNRDLLTEEEILTVAFLIKHHGIYGEIDRLSRKNGQRFSDKEYLGFYEVCLKELEKLKTPPMVRKIDLIDMLFLFNIVEGLQTDVFSKDFYMKDNPKNPIKDKFEDILNTRKLVLSYYFPRT